MNVTTDIPDWLKVHTEQLVHAIEHNLPTPDPRFPTTKVQRELRQHNLECLFERILDGMCEGNSASAVIKLDHNHFSVGEVMKWILTDAERKKRYNEIDSIRQVVRVDRARTIVDDETADPTYKKEVVEFTKWEAAKANREKYGDRTTVEMNVTKVDIKALIEKREQSLLDINSTPTNLTSLPRQGNTYDVE